VNPQQLEVGVIEEKSATGRALARMSVGRAFGESELNQASRFRTSSRCEDEKMIEFY
jgi:hypothetical protein